VTKFVVYDRSQLFAAKLAEIVSNTFSNLNNFPPESLQTMPASNHCRTGRSNPRRLQWADPVIAVTRPCFAEAINSSIPVIGIDELRFQQYRTRHSYRTR
jgi:hypothetical protein